MIDIHSHILPGVDDGSKDENMTLRMLYQFSNEGIDKIIVTPHFRHDQSEAYLDKVKQGFLKAQDLAAQVSPDLKLYLGCEIMYSSKALTRLVNDEFMTMNGTDYVLVEFPVLAQFNDIAGAIRDFVSSGYIPIVAHLERYQFIGKIEQVHALVKMGAYIQINSSLILGKYGFARKRFIHKLIKRGLVHFVASDAHNDEKRKVTLGSSYRTVARRFGKETAADLFIRNQEKVIKGEKIGV